MFELINAALGSFYNTLITVAWIILPVFLAAVFWTLRLYQKRMEFISKIDWIILEINPPKDLVKTPKAMEQVFSALYGIYSFGIKAHDKYLDGKVDLWLSLEMMGRGGGIHFYVRCAKQHRNLVESAIYAQYPDAEITETFDYVDEMPSVLPNETWDLWGTGFTFAADSAYPIRTYPYFEEVKEEKRIDPISTISEAMSKLKDDEMIWIQLLISPIGPQTGEDFKKEGDKTIQKIVDSTREPKGSAETISLGMWKLTPSQQDVIKAIGAKVSKLAFHTCLRFVYIDKKNEFTMSNVSSVMSSFQLYNTRDMNAFRPDKLVTAYSEWWGRLFPWYKKYVIASKKRKLFDYYRKRRFGYSGKMFEEKLPTLNTEELATIFHFPAGIVKAPKLQTIYSRKGEPPVNLPIGK
jgi:hypothetical protein